MVVERADEGVSVAIFGCGDGGLGLDDGVDAADWGTGVSKVRGGRGASLHTKLAAAVGLRRAESKRIPLWATSVAISNRRWFLTSRAAFTPSAAMVICGLRRIFPARQKTELVG